MTTPAHGAPAAGTPPPMTPERWRAVDAILQAALAREPEGRDAVVAEACGEDEALRIEVASLLAAHVDADDDFLERPAAEALGALDAAPLAGRLANANAPLAALGAELAGRYAIDREIARGGMATVHLARDLRHGRRVAIKVLREEIAAAVGPERFLAEIRVTASLQHPHILPLFDSGSVGCPPEAGGWLLWYAMPFVDGETLRSRLAREGPLPVAEAVRLAREIADALDHAHGRGIVHRDVKPENILLQPAPANAGGHALVADFGIALALQQAGGERLTRTGLALGTPQYMAPEQAAGERALDARVDVYALGAVLYEMLAGEPPFAAATRQAVVHRLMHDPPPALATRRPDVPPFLDSAVRRALAKRPDDRFPTAAAFAAALAEPPAVPLATPTDGAESAGAPAGGSAPRVTAHGRVVSARSALYAAAAALVVGLAGGLLVGRSSLVRRWTDNAPAAVARLGAGPAGGGGLLAPAGDLSLIVLDRAGRPLRAIPAESPWTPRFSPDGRRVAYGAFGAGRNTSDLWVTDLDAGTTRRLTDGDADANDPQWSADGASIAYSESAPAGKDLALRPLDGGTGRVIASRDGTQFPSDWLRDGSALLVTEHAGPDRYDILVQPVDGSAARPYAATPADETAARISPDGRWVAYTSDESGRAEVYLDSYPRPGRRVTISSGGGVHPVWRGDGRELYYWRDGALVAVRLGAAARGAPPARGDESVLFRAPYHVGVNTMYDVSPDGERFAIVRQR
ncbi:MAG TPA: protein kinase [Gemmatimonadaceae bacterium]|nr:protein kinase [Gemmatimonadaceae bacterium]